MINLKNRDWQKHGSVKDEIKDTFSKKKKKYYEGEWQISSVLQNGSM